MLNSKSSKKTPAALLALLAVLPAVLPALTSCGGGGESTQTSDTTAMTADTTTVSDSTSHKLMPDIPAQDFGGQKFTFLTTGVNDDNGENWQTTDIYTEAENGDVVNDAVFARNMYINATYNVEIAEVQAQGKIVEDAKTVILAGDTTYGGIVGNLSACANLA